MIDILQFNHVVVRREDDFMFDFDEPSRGKRRVSTQWNWVVNTNQSQTNWVVSTHYQHNCVGQQAPILSGAQIAGWSTTFLHSQCYFWVIA